MLDAVQKGKNVAQKAEEIKAKFYRSEGHASILLTLRDFCKIAKKSGLNNLFLQSFAELVQQKESQSQNKILSQMEINQVLRSMDVIIAMVAEVQLKRENQIALMQGIKVFVADIKTRKKAYRLLALVVQNFDLTNGIEELKGIKRDVSPILEGQATKQRLGLIRAYIEQIKKVVNGDSKGWRAEEVGEMLREFTIEVMGGMSNSNLKIRQEAERILREVSQLMRTRLNMVNQLFTTILVGMAGSNVSTQTAAIRCLLLVVKENVILSDEQEKRIKEWISKDQRMDDDNMFEDEGFVKSDKEKGMNFENMLKVKDAPV